MASAVKKYTVEVSSLATEMLISHARFLAQVNENAATRLISAFEKHAKSLENMPDRCPRLVDPMIPADKYRKLIFEKRYIIVFQVKGTVVFIDAVIDCRQDYGWLFL